MKNKLFLFIFLFMLLPFAGQGQTGGNMDTSVSIFNDLVQTMEDVGGEESEEPTATVTVLIIDGTDKPVEGVTIAAKTDEGLVITGISDANGMAKLTELPIGKTYTFTITSLPEEYTSYYSIPDPVVIEINGDESFTWTLVPNIFEFVDAVPPTLTYKQEMGNYDLNELLKIDEDKDCGAITFSATGLPAGLTLTSEGVISGTPTEATAEDVTVTITAIAENGSSRTQDVIFSIVKLALTVTPKANQVVYADDVIIYDVAGIATGDEPQFNGTLKAENGQAVSGGGFALTDEFAKNYTFSVTPVAITECSGKASEAVATIETATSLNGWFTSDPTLTAPTDFQIALVSSTLLKSKPEYAETLTLTTEGERTVTYLLKRLSRADEWEKTLNVKLDKTAPTLTATTRDLSYTLTFGDGLTGSGIDLLTVDGLLVTPTSATTYTATGTAGTHQAKVTDKAGLSSAEITFTLKAEEKPVDPMPDPDPIPDPDPDPTPDPVPTYYKVTLLPTEGIRFSPSPGEHWVEEGESFYFSLTVSEGYGQQSVPVVKANGVAITPDEKDGHYTLSSIGEDKIVTVEGLVKDTPSGNEPVTPITEVRTEGHTLCITVADDRLCHLLHASGRLLRSYRLVSGMNRIDGLTAGLYFVKIEGEGTWKIAIFGH